MANRELDDVYKRINAKDSYKNRRFNYKKSLKDDYTGERIFYGNSMESTNKHPLNKTADVDHITPISVVKKRYKDLTLEQQRKLANNQKYNYAMTNSELNRNSRTGKNALENHEYLAKKVGNMTNAVINRDYSEATKVAKDLSNKSGRMLTSEVKSRAGMAIEASSMRIDNTVHNIKEAMQENGMQITSTSETVALGAKEALENSVVFLTAESVRQLCLVANGDKKLDEAVSDIGSVTIDVALTQGVNQVIKISNNEILLKIAGSNEIKQIINVALIVKDTAIAYINGEINEKEFISQVGQKGTVMVTGMIGGKIGGDIGVIIGSISGTAALPGFGTAGGAIAGKIIGEVFGTIITTIACSAIITVLNATKTVFNTSKHINDYKLKENQIKKIESDALNEMSNQRNKLREIFVKEYSYWDDEIQGGFDMIMVNACQQTYSIQGVTEGIDRILSIFDKKVAFNSINEWEAQVGSKLVLKF